MAGQAQGGSDGKEARTTEGSAANDPPRRVLIVEDHEDTRNSFQQLLELSLGLEVDLASDGEEALERLSERPYSIVITDLRMPKLDGLGLIEEIQQRRLPVTIIVTTGHGSIPDAVRAMRMGAYDFLTKPPDPQHVCLLVERALRERTLQDELAALKAQLAGRQTFQNVLSKSPRMFSVFDLINQVAPTVSTVLIEGETGTGKEMVAQAIHQASSAHRPGAFVAVHCAALSETLFESELFGHEKGSFTGAAGQRRGRLEQADRGTLFLDEVGDIPMAMQIKLLRVLQERKFERVGGNTPIRVDVRVVAATHRDLTAMIREGKFREDLFYRLNVVKLEVPPLRDRAEDIPLLAAHFAQKYAHSGQPPYQIAPDAMERLIEYSWPGNVRQLENAIERACVTATESMIRAENLPPEVSSRPVARKGGPSVDLSRPLSEQLSELTAAFEERYLRRALKRCRGHVGRCAKLSGLSRRSVTAKIGQYKIDTSQYKQV